jgi:hypothetical protein
MEICLDPYWTCPVRLWTAGKGLSPDGVDNVAA